MSTRTKEAPGNVGDATPVTGGCDIPARLLRPTPALGVVPDDDLGKHIVRLLTLHPNLALEFRSEDLRGMDDVTKHLLIEDLEAVLGIEPLQEPAR
jgi:hypothetical protein